MNTAHRVVLKDIRKDAGRLPSRLIFARSPFTIERDGLLVEARIGCFDLHENDNPLVRISIDGAKAAIRLSYGSMRHLCEGPIEGLTEEDQALLLEDALSPWLDDLEQITGLSIRILDIGSDFLEEPNHKCQLLVSAKRGAEDVFTCSLPVFLTPPALAPLSLVLDKYRHKREVAERIRLNCRYSLLARSYSLKTLRSLCVGDVITVSRSKEQGYLLIEQSFRLPVCHDEHMLVVSGKLEPLSLDVNSKPLQSYSWRDEDMEKDMSEQLSGELGASSSEAVLNEVDDIKVTLSITAGEIQISVGELRQLETGSTLRLPNDQPGDVELTVNGQRIGKGVLITIGEAPAVEVTHLA